MYLFGRKYTKKEICEKIGDISQITNLKNHEYTDGVSNGIKAVDMDNGNGLEITVLHDRGIDISKAVYKGASLTWKSPTKETHPAYYDPEGMEWMKTFYGGLLVTCGLTYFGAPDKDGNENLGLHGRIGNSPAFGTATEGYWEGDDYWIYTKGKVREVNINSFKLEIERKVSMKIGEDKIFIDDTIENIGFKTSPLMTLYHMNFGFPLIDVTTELELFKHKVLLHLDDAVNHKKDYTKFFEPRDDFKWRVYFHELEPDKNGFCNALLINKNFNNSQGFAVYIKYKKENLPYLNEWVMMGKSDYVVGIEPSNCPGRGRSIERNENFLRYIEPGEIIKNKIEIGILTNNKDIFEYKNSVERNLKSI